MKAPIVGWGKLFDSFLEGPSWAHSPKERSSSKSLKLLELLERAGDKGMSFTEVQRSLWEMTYPPECDGRIPANTRPWDPRSSSCRGYWCTNLLGGPHYHGGLLRTFAVKGEDGRWRRNGRAHHGKPWSVLSGRSCSCSGHLGASLE